MQFEKKIVLGFDTINNIINIGTNLMEYIIDSSLHIDDKINLAYYGYLKGFLVAMNNNCK